MIGNDIVDLSMSHIGEGIRRARYLAKIFTKEERDIIDHLGNDDIWIWLLWSVKESVYKVVSRKEQIIRYAPKSLVCLNIKKKSESNYETIVEYNGEQFVVVSHVNDKYVHSVTATSNSNQSISDVFTISPDENKSESIDEKVLTWIRENTKIEYNNTIIIRDAHRVPHIYHGNKELYFLSMSHHGKFGAFSISNNQTNVEHFGH